MKNPRALTAALLLLVVTSLTTACVKTAGIDGWSAPAFSGETVYYAEAKDRLAAVSITDAGAARRWVFPDDTRNEDKDLNLRAIYGESVLADGRVYFSSFQGGVFALSADTGRPVWGGKREGVSGNIAAGVALAGDKLVFATTEGQVHVWNAADGRPAPGWENPLDVGEAVWAAPVISGDTIFIATMEGEVHALSLTDRSEKWNAPFDATGAIAELTLLDEGRLFAASLNRNAYILDPATGAVISDFRARDWVWTEPAFRDGIAYFGDFSGRTYALDITTGVPLWESDAANGDRIRSGPALVGDVLVVADRDPVIHFLDAKTGRELNRVPIEGAGTIRANAIADNGSVYVVTTKGRLYRADPQAGRVTEVQVGGTQR